MRKKGFLAIVILALLLAGCGAAKQQPKDLTALPDQKNQTEQKDQAEQKNQPQQQAQPGGGKRKTYDAPPRLTIDQSKQYIATVETTLGTFKVELFAKDAPRTVNNFVFLSREGFYDGTKFHRIIKGFMIQGGDPLGTGGGGPGYKFADELPPKRPYTRGIVAMANSGPDTQGSQFFICTGADCGGLDQYPDYTQFGVVTEGLDVVEKLESVETVKAPNSRDRVPSFPKDPPSIRKITIEEK